MYIYAYMYYVAELTISPNIGRIFWIIKVGPTKHTAVIKENFLLPWSKKAEEESRAFEV